MQVAFLESLESCDVTNFISFYRGMVVPWESVFWGLGGKNRTHGIPTFTGAMKKTERLVGLQYIGDEILPSFIGIIINHYKDPY